MVILGFFVLLGFVSPYCCVVNSVFTGRLDFWVDSNLKWAIELLIKSDKRQDHFHRFNPNMSAAKYYRLQPSAWRVVDFVNSNPECENPHYISVKIDNDYRGAQVTFVGRQNLSAHVPFLGDVTDDANVQRIINVLK
jgi:hypothetical protein